MIDASSGESMALETGVLVVGADGVIGSAVAAELESRQVPVVRTSRRGTAGSIPLDLSRPATWDAPARFSAAVLCAAVSGTEQCRAHPQTARAVNVDATVALARRLTRAGHRVVFLSSNLVFDGTRARTPADAPRCPRTVYGHMKAEAEEAILTLGELATVVRLTKVLHGGMHLLTNWRAALARGQPIRPFADLPVAPVSLAFASAVIAAVSIDGRGGIVQASATHDVMYAELARHVATAGGFSGDLVRPVAAAESGIPLEHVPMHATLDGTLLEERFGFAAPDPLAAVETAFAAG